jgi:hypothetical protein
MRLTALFAATALLAFSTQAFAQSEEDVMNEIEFLHGQSIEFGEAFATLQDAFLFDNLSALADLGSYPFEVAANGELHEITEPAEFIDNIDALLTTETIDALASQDYADLIVTSDGVGFGNGALWMSLVCLDEACSEASWGIIRINN